MVGTMVSMSKSSRRSLSPMRLSRKSKSRSKSPKSVQKKIPLFAVGSTVKWARYNGDTETTSSGKVINVHTSRVTYIINGKERTFNATTNKPVYEVMTEDGYPEMLNVPRVFSSIFEIGTTQSLSNRYL
ncbi:g26 [Coccomyxa elongata]